MGKPSHQFCGIGTAALGGFAAVLSIAALATGSPFASTVLDYTPAPGQFINSTTYNDPIDALGPPAGGGTLAANNSMVVSLGGFGGSITLGFAKTILDDPRNPYGLDAIVFGNAFWTGGDATRRFAEAGIIEIAQDVNSNGIADDPWYVVKGSSLPQQPIAAATTQAWDDDPDTSLPPSNVAWYPDPAIFPGIPNWFETSGYLLPLSFQSIPLINPSEEIEAFYGYADMSPTILLGDLNGDNIVDDPEVQPDDFYTRPDNPFIVGVSPGSGGGDAFDIAWAVDPTTGEPAHLPGFDFIRISSGAHALAGLFGEISTEVCAVAAVTENAAFYDINVDGALNVEDLYRWHSIPIDLTGELSVNAQDRMALQRAVRTGESHDMTGGMP